MTQCKAPTAVTNNQIKNIKSTRLFTKRIYFNKTLNPSTIATARHIQVYVSALAIFQSIHQIQIYVKTFQQASTGNVNIRYLYIGT